MKSIWTIACKDFKGILFSPLFFVLSGLCMLVWSYKFNQGLHFFAQQSLQSMSQMNGMGGMGGGGGLNLHQHLVMPHIGAVNLLLFLVIPAMTMRLLAEEKRQRTYDLLLTSPITATQIVAGKFIAGFGIASLLLLLSFIYPVTVSGLTDIEWLMLISTYVAVLFLAGAYVSIGIFASSLTQSHFLAIVIAVILNTLLWFVGAGNEMFDSPLLKSFFEHANLSQHLSAMVSGSIKLSGFVFFLTIIFLNCFLTQRVIESSRWR